MYTTTTRGSVLLQLAREGWHPGPPGHTLTDAVAIDAETCSEVECDRCGTVGMDYHPMHRGRHYRVIARCPVCGGEVEL